MGNKSTVIRFTKSVAWCYPSSADAKLHGFYKTGCWGVAIHDIEENDIPVSIRGYPTKMEAVAFADTLTQAWNKYSDHAVNHK